MSIQTLKNQAIVVSEITISNEYLSNASGYTPQSFTITPAGISGGGTASPTYTIGTAPNTVELTCALPNALTAGGEVLATDTGVAATYLTQANAATTYLSQTDAATTYLTQADAATTYQPIGNYVASTSISALTITGVSIADGNTVVSIPNSNANSVLVVGVANLFPAESGFFILGYEYVSGTDFQINFVGVTSTSVNLSIIAYNP